jgi:hypothetical protein
MASMDYQETLKKCQKLSQALQKILKAKNRHDSEFIKLLKSALAAAQEFPQEQLVINLERHLKDLEAQTQELLRRRREALLFAAKEAGLPHKRFDGYDRIGPLKVLYREKKVILEIGSEKMRELEEVDGSQLLATIKESLASLEKEPFKREEFFRQLKYAYFLKKEELRPRDGWVPIRELFPVFVLTRQLANRAFMAKPESRTFQAYSTAQFVYDLSRFGRQDWGCNGERVETRTPSMRETQYAMTLPNLESVEKSGPQIAHFRIVKRESG